MQYMYSISHQVYDVILSVISGIGLFTQSVHAIHVQYFSSGLWCYIYCLLFLELGSLLSQFMQYIYSIFHLDCDIVFVYHLLFLEVVVSLNQIILTIHIIQYFQSGLWCCILSRLIYYGVLYSKSYLVFDVVFHHTLFLQLLLLFITSFIQSVYVLIVQYFSLGLWSCISSSGLSAITSFTQLVYAVFLQYFLSVCIYHVLFLELGTVFLMRSLILCFIIFCYFWSKVFHSVS